MYRFVTKEIKNLSLKDIINIAADRYNNTMHSVIKKKPADVFFNRTERFNVH